MKILIVDDEPIIRKSFKLMLSDISDDYITDEANNGETAMAKISEFKPDLVLVDIVMPKVDGIELLKWIMTEHPDLKSMVLSSHDDFHYVKEAFIFGATNYLLKYEVTKEDLAKAVREAMSKTSEKLSEAEQQSVFYECGDDSITAGAISHELPPEIVEMKKHLFNSIYETDIGEIYASFERIYRSVSNNRTVSVQVVKIMYTSIAEALQNKFSEIFSSEAISLDDMNMKIVNATLHEEIKALFDECFSSVFRSVINIANVNNCSGIIKQIVEYINKNYSDGKLSLQSLAVHFGYSDAYISRKFKQEIGMNVIDYINSVRVKVASRMIADSDLKIYEIAEAVGFNNYNYFSKTFKRIMGNTPAEYESYMGP